MEESTTTESAVMESTAGPRGENSDPLLTIQGSLREIEQRLVEREEHVAQIQSILSSETTPTDSIKTAVQDSLSAVGQEIRLLRQDQMAGIRNVTQAITKLAVGEEVIQARRDQMSGIDKITQALTEMANAVAARGPSLERQLEELKRVASAGRPESPEPPPISGQTASGSQILPVAGASGGASIISTPQTLAGRQPYQDPAEIEKQQQERSSRFPKLKIQWETISSRWRMPDGTKVWDPNVVDGFPKAAEFIVRDRDNTSAIFTRFDLQSVRNILYHQARVAALGKRQKDFDAEDYAISRSPERLARLDARLARWTAYDRLDQIAEEDLKERLVDLELCLKPDIELLDVERLTPFRRLRLPASGAAIMDFLSNDFGKRSIKDPIRHLLTQLANETKVTTHQLYQYLDKDLHKLQPQEDIEIPGSIIIGALEIYLQHPLKKELKLQMVISKSLTQVAKSWEDFEMFGNPEKMKKKRQEWNATTPWPFEGLPDKWIEKMRERWDLAREMKSALREYHEALVLLNKVFKLPTPAHRTAKALKTWVARGQFSDSSQKMFGSDLASIRPPGEEDTISKFIATRLPFLVLDLETSTYDVQYISERSVIRWVTFMNMIAGIGTLVVAVWVLSVINKYKTEEPTEKDQKVSKEELAALTGFVVFFAVWVGYMTSASRKEVFGAIAIYAAVLVVFVGSGA